MTIEKLVECIHKNEFKSFCDTLFVLPDEEKCRLGGPVEIKVRNHTIEHTSILTYAIFEKRFDVAFELLKFQEVRDGIPMDCAIEYATLNRHSELVRTLLSFGAVQAETWYVEDNLLLNMLLKSHSYNIKDNQYYVTNSAYYQDDQVEQVELQDILDVLNALLDNEVIAKEAAQNNYSDEYVTFPARGGINFAKCFFDHPNIQKYLRENDNEALLAWKMKVGKGSKLCDKFIGFKVDQLENDVSQVEPLAMNSWVSCFKVFINNNRRNEKNNNCKRDDESNNSANKILRIN
jgi:hypothetical protein